MPSILLEYRLRVRDAANLTDALIITSVRGDTLPWVEGPPNCDGQEINPLTGEFRSGAYTGVIVDGITSGTTRAVTSQLEDVNFRQQLAGRIAYWEFRTNGGAWTVLGAGFLTLIRLVDGVRWEITISDATRVEENALAFSPKKGALVLSASATSAATSIAVTALPFAIASGAVLTFLSGRQVIATAPAAAGATSVSIAGGTVTVAAPGAAIAATSLPVSALPAALLSGMTLLFASGKLATLAADAALGATSLAVVSLAAAIATGDTAPVHLALTSGDTAPITESFVSYFARWPQRGCVFGGPISGGGFLGVPDLRGWLVFAQSNSSTGGPTTFEGTTFLQPITSYFPPNLTPVSSSSQGAFKAGADTPNSAVAPLVIGTYAYAPGFPSEFKSFWPGLVYQLGPFTTGFTGASSEFYSPEEDSGFGGPAPFSSKATNGIIDTKHGKLGPCVIGTSLTVGPGSTLFRMRALTCLPTDASPLYWTGHPIDLFKALMDEQSRAFDSTACETVRQAVGADRRISLRIAGALPTVNDILKSAVYAPFGIGVRMNGAGQLQPFTMRIFDNSPPTTTITAADIRSDSGGGTGIQSWFELDESTAIRSFVFEWDNFYLIQDAAGHFPPDGVAIQHFRIERTNGDPGAVGSGVATFSVPGMVHAKNAQLAHFPGPTGDETVQEWVNQLALEIFDRWGRGVLTGELPLLRGGAGDSLTLGDECLNAVPQLPNKNKRLGDDGTVGARAMQIVRSTPSPVGALVKLIDSGPNAGAVATLPTLAIAAAPGRRAIHVAQITILNAAALNAVLCGIELQWSVTLGTTPAATDYTPVGASVYGAIPLSTVTLPSVLFGSMVWVRARTTQYGARASAWTTPISVTLGGLNPPTSLSVTPNGSDGSQELATWTPGVNADQAAVDVYVRPSAQPASTAVRVQILPPGSSRYNLELLTPNTSYTVGVQSRDLETNDVSAVNESTFTTANVTVTLAVPLYPQWFVGAPNPVTGIATTDGSYGMAVYASVFPGGVEFWEAVETSIGSGTYGTSVLVDPAPSISGDWTKTTRTAQNDGLRRQLKARHTRDGATASSFTAIGTVSPWGTPTRLALPPFTRSVPTADDGQFTVTGDSNFRVTDQRRLNQVSTGSINSQQTSRPLSSSSNTVDSTITIAAHTLKYGFGTVSYNSGSILIPGAVSGGAQTFYIYADDPTYAGGAVTYIATTAIEDVVSNSGRYYVGKITPIPSTTTNQVGGGGGSQQLH